MTEHWRRSMTEQGDDDRTLEEVDDRAGSDDGTLEEIDDRAGR